MNSIHKLLHPHILPAARYTVTIICTRIHRFIQNGKIKLNVNETIREFASYVITNNVWHG